MLLVVTTTRANAGGDDLANWLVGPVVGIRLGHARGASGSVAIVGLEGGVGYGPERINLGFEHRSDHDFGYIEIDPWYFFGGTLGFGINDDGNVDGVAGIWEGIPLSNFKSCTDWHPQLTLSGGYRYTGVHELYLTIKAGEMHGNVCID